MCEYICMCIYVYTTKLIMYVNICVNTSVTIDYSPETILSYGHKSWRELFQQIGRPEI